VDGPNKINVSYSPARLFSIHEADRFTVNRQAHSFSLPPNLASGGYLLRHEIIALHLADQPGGAEFYPSCIQINVSGSQSGAPSPNELVRFPGAYSDNDAGILVNAFTNDAYDFPGPPVSKLASSAPGNGSNDGDNNGEDGSPSSSPAPSNGTGVTKTPVRPSSTAVPPPKNGSGHCNSKKKRATYDASDDSTPSVPRLARRAHQNGFKPRHISRVMARMIKPHTH
jgi:hypothetical protein